MKGTVNGKSLDQVLSELKAPFPEEELKKNEKNETYIPVESLESRLNSVIGVLNYDTLVTYEGIQEVLGRFVVVAKTILIIYDDERNALIRKSALGGSNIIVVKDTGKPSSLKTDIAAAQSESFKNVCKLLQIGISQIRSGKQRRGQNGTKQRREEKNLYKIRFTSSLSAGNKCYKGDYIHEKSIRNRKLYGRNSTGYFWCCDEAERTNSGYCHWRRRWSYRCVCCRKTEW